MKKNIVHKSRRKLDGIISVRFPTLASTNLNRSMPGLHLANNSQTRQRRSFEAHCAPRTSKVAQHDKVKFISSDLQVWCNVERIIVPGQRAASGRAHRDSSTVDEQLIARVRREMQSGRLCRCGQVEFMHKVDNFSDGIGTRRINPIRDPDPVCSKSLDRLMIAVLGFLLASR